MGETRTVAARMACAFGHQKYGLAAMWRSCEAPRLSWGFALVEVWTACVEPRQCLQDRQHCRSRRDDDDGQRDQADERRVGGGDDDRGQPGSRPRRTTQARSFGHQRYGGWRDASCGRPYVPKMESGYRLLAFAFAASCDRRSISAARSGMVI
jgi:hypothetical protein